MRIIDLLRKDSIEIGANAVNKERAIDILIDLHEKCSVISDKEKFRKEIFKRENASTTALPNGIAIPHAKSDSVKKTSLSAITLKKGIDFSSPDKKPTKLIFMIAATNDADTHLEVLSKLMTLLVDNVFCNKLINAKDCEEFLRLIDEKESERFTEQSTVTPSVHKAFYDVLAVTACPTGIAHTFMAAESLEKKAKEMGVSIKVETNGSAGAKNILTDEEIENCKGIIVAADREVNTARFDNKRVLFTKVADGIHKPEVLINNIIEEKSPIFHTGNTSKEEKVTRSDNAGQRIYRHLMNGVSNMLPFVIGGGIMIAISFLIDTILSMPQDGAFGTHTEASQFFNSIGSIAFSFMMPVLSGFIAMSIGDRPGLAVGFVGGMLATTGSTFLLPLGDSNSISGFLGALAAGFLSGYIVLLIKRIFSFLPKSMEGIKPVLIYPLLGIILIGVIMCALNPYVGMLNNLLFNALNRMNTASRVLLGAVLGGMMAIDMGGPFNKAAYVFGTASLATGGYNIMASVMIGGMVPPLAIALCATIFKNKFSEKDRKSAMVNYVMGLCFITEGAIPFAAADPIRVIPSCIIGSSIAGALSMVFDCSLMAPHGGIFVFPVVTNALQYFIALAVGTISGAVILGLVKKSETEKKVVKNYG
ncbi:MAG: PTS sugar transporter subunit IIA [Oscillospiraceae bacterium]|nr:PTS sugar transporter subunit IIA [Candidatus Ruminococcus equi]